MYAPQLHRNELAGFDPYQLQPGQTKLLSRLRVQTETSTNESRPSTFSHAYFEESERIIRNCPRLFFTFTALSYPTSPDVHHMRDLVYDPVDFNDSGYQQVCYFMRLSNGNPSFIWLADAYNFSPDRLLLSDLSKTILTEYDTHEKRLVPPDVVYELLNWLDKPKHKISKETNNKAARSRLRTRILIGESRVDPTREAELLGKLEALEVAHQDDIKQTQAEQRVQCPKTFTSKDRLNRHTKEQHQGHKEESRER